jgi:uncharacterized RDD family membrane protein YckC
MQEVPVADTGLCSSCGFVLVPQPAGKTIPYDPNATSPGPPDAGPTAPPVTTIGGFRLLRAIGAGGMGGVFEAEQIATGRRVAVKLISSELAARPEAIDRFRREGRVASSITHPRCVFVVTADEDQGRPYIAMELMPGTTLRDLVAEHGPLPLADAVAKVLDVIEGLKALHRRGIIHRDVKPANCFVEENGRVKVGDFGLARSLLAGAELTQTGKFLGTTLYASLEQLKGEALDERADVYSVSATLYFLLAGRAPFQGTDGAAVIARVASEPAPPLRTVRPDLPAALDRIVLRGLDRDRRRRWRSLDELESALERFRPPRLTVGGMGLRLAAFLIDYGLLIGIWYLLNLALNPLGVRIPTTEFGPEKFLAASAADFVYFTVFEGLLGFGLGKWLLRLRVTRRGSDRRPGLLRAAVRSAVFYSLFYLPYLMVHALPLDCITMMILHALISVKLGGIPLVMLTMRERNGYRGLHEFLSGTCVVYLPRRRKTSGAWLRGQPSPDLLAQPLPAPANAPTAVGPFRVLGAVSDAVWLGRDDLLERNVLIWIRPAAAPPLSAEQQHANRLTRLRWLDGGTQGDLRWDAFIAQGGCPLRDLVGPGPPLTWLQARPLVQQLADELAAASADHSLPATLATAQVWVQPSGQVQLFDMPVGKDTQPARPANEQAALDLLAEVAVLTLEGRRRPSDPGTWRVRTPLPLHAVRMLTRLKNTKQPYNRVDEFRADLAATQEKPVRVTRFRRFIHLLAQFGLLFALGVVLFIASSLFRGAPVRSSIIQGAIWITVIGVWPALARGGPSFALCGLALVRSDGRPAEWWQALLRSLLVWSQGAAVCLVVALLWAAFAGPLPPNFPKLDNELSWTVFGIVWAYAILIAALPRRTWHDRLIGLHVVPR